jgi:RNA polymerase sigma-70 factor (ECF subfamily)
VPERRYGARIRAQRMMEQSPHDLDPTAADAAADAAQAARNRALESALARAAAGDSEAWREVVVTIAPRVHGLLASLCRDDELAEEITQSVFCTVAAKLQTYVESGRFEPWIFRIATNRLRDEMRRRTRHARAVGDEVLDARAVRSSRGSRGGSDELRELLRRAMERLGEGDREILDLRHIGGLSFKALSDYFEEPIGTLLARHHRALRKLRAILEEMGVDGLDVGDSADGEEGR